MQALIETWQINQKMNESLISGIKGSHFLDLSTTKGRNVGEQFAHIHNVRLMWLKVAAPDLLESQKKFEKEEGFTKELLLVELKNSTAAITELLQRGFATGRIKGFKPHPEAFLSYMIAHEAQDRKS